MKKFLLLAVSLPLVFIGCKKDEPEPNSQLISLSQTETTLYVGESYNIGAIASSDATITYTAENEFYAEVTSWGVCSARHVGETTITLSTGEDTKTFKVIVKGKNNLYPEPDVKLGDYKSAIIAKFGTPDEESQYLIGYNNYSNAAYALLFAFDDYNKLIAYGVLVESTYVAELVPFLTERYLSYNRENPNNDEIIFINALDSASATMAIVLQQDTETSDWLVTYTLPEDAIWWE